MSRGIHRSKARDTVKDTGSASWLIGARAGGEKEMEMEMEMGMGAQETRQIILQSIALWLMPRWQRCQHSLQEAVMAALSFHYLLRAPRAGSSECGVDRDHTFYLCPPSVSLKWPVLRAVLSLSARQSRRATMWRLIFIHHKTQDGACLVLFFYLSLCVRRDNRLGGGCPFYLFTTTSYSSNSKNLNKMLV